MQFCVKLCPVNNLDGYSGSGFFREALQMVFQNALSSSMLDMGHIHSVRETPSYGRAAFSADAPGVNSAKTMISVNASAMIFFICTLLFSVI